MLASLNFVERFARLPRTSQAVTLNNVTFTRSQFDLQTISPLLTRQGFEVESVTHFGDGFDGVVVGRIEKAERHPNAEKLQVCQVNLGGNRVVQIVCGAKNAREGLYVAAATPGTKLPGEKDIKVSTIRDVQSNGMLCSRAELGLPVNEAVDGDGIWELHVDAQGGLKESELAGVLGWPVFDGLHLRDTLLELNVTPNRPDMLSHAGVAREILAGLAFAKKPSPPNEFRFSGQTKLNIEQIFTDVVKNDQIKFGTQVVRAANELGAPTFFLGLEGVTVGPSPAWLRNQLEALGQSSVNNIVDASNYVLLGFGQPSHAFDTDKLSQTNNVTDINLRFANTNEAFVGLDGKSRELQSTDCVVADSKGAHALLGILGGEHSKVDATTTRVLIEFANPGPVAVRRTSRRIGRITDASFAFEKGIDTANRWTATTELIGLITTMSPSVKYLGGMHSVLKPDKRTSAAKEFVSDDELKAACGPLLEKKVCVDATIVADTTFAEAKDGAWKSYIDATKAKQMVSFSKNELSAVLGAQIADEASQHAILTSLGFQVSKQSDGVSVRTPPWRRRDISGPADLVEEVIRVVGIDSVPSTPIASLGVGTRDDAHLAPIEAIANRMVAVGYTEVVGLHFMREDDWSKLNLASPVALGTPVAVLNPIIQDEPWLHNTLMPDLLRKVRFNVSYGTKRGQIFEVARTFVNLDNEAKTIFSDNHASLSQMKCGIDLQEYSPSLALTYSADKGARPAETPRLAGVCFGNQSEKTWHNSSATPFTVHALISHISETLRPLGLSVVSKTLPATHPIFPMLHPGRAAHVLLQNSDGITIPLGWVGALHPKVLRHYEIDCETLGFEINLAVAVREALTKTTAARTRHPRRFPTVVRDFSILVGNEVTAANIQSAVRASLEPLFQPAVLPARLTDITIFDVYRGQGVATGQKSVAFSISIDPLERTLTDADIQKIYNATLEGVQKHCGAQMRGS